MRKDQQVSGNLPRVRLNGAVRLFGPIIALALMAVVILSAAGYADEMFRSFNGGFRVTLPDGWSQVDYRTADYHLANAGADLDYEAAFDGNPSDPVFASEYLILTLDTTSALADSTGKLIPAEVDSVLSGVAADFDKKLVRIGSRAFRLQEHQDVVAYDTVHHVVYAVSTIDAETDDAHMNLLAMKLYKNGVANFFFYSDESSFTDNLPDFEAILASFSTDMQAANDGSGVKVADLDEKLKKEDVTNSTVVITAAVLAVFVIALVLLSRRKRRKA